jgi:hypothetical protein
MGEEGVNCPTLLDARASEWLEAIQVARLLNLPRLP